MTPAPTPALTIVGHPASQPARTVYWTCVLHDLPFALVDVTASPPADRATNPRGQVPYIIDDGFFLSEMAAIVCYLADKHGWADIYPKPLEVRARIQQYLHMQHSLVRLATLKLMAPHVMKPLGLAVSDSSPQSMLSRELLTSAFAAEDPLADGRAVVRIIADFLEDVYFADDSPFVCNTPTASVADLACYAELGQLQFAKLFDFQGYPKIQRWLAAMAQVRGHDVIQAYNIQLGDIATTPNTMERFVAASEAGFTALRQTGLAV